jgi:hypothetical protein
MAGTEPTLSFFAWMIIGSQVTNHAAQEVTERRPPQPADIQRTIVLLDSVLESTVFGTTPGVLF